MSSASTTNKGHAVGSHRRFFAVLITIVLLASPLFTTTSEAGAAPPGVSSNGEVVVRLSPAAANQLVQIVDQYGVLATRPLIGLSDTYLFTVPDGTAGATVAALSHDPRLAFAERNYLLDARAPTDAVSLEAMPFWAFPFWAFPFWAYQYSGGTDAAGYTDQAIVELLELDAAQSVSRGLGVTVAVIDTGVDLTHPLLQSNLVAGFDTLDDDNDPTDVRAGVDTDADGRTDEAFGHGTMVASLVTLVAPDAAIMPIRALDSDGVGDEFAIAQGLLLAANNGADVINLSLGTRTPSELLDQAIEEVAHNGVIVLSAAGNYGTTDTVYPAEHGDTIAVGAVDSDFHLAPFSSYGKRIDLVMPGVEVVSAFPKDEMHPNGNLILWSGTSAATPLASGFAALSVATQAIHGVDIEVVFDAASVDLDDLNPGLKNQIGDGTLSGSLFRDFILNPVVAPRGGNRGRH